MISCLQRMNQSKQRNKAIIHTDGSCSNNPGPGGWAAILDGYECRVCVCGREDDSTNNRMELKAFLEALILAENEYALNSNVSIVIYTDSKYVENPINNGWIHKWILSEFKGIKNIDLWTKVIEILLRLDVDIVWIKRDKNLEADKFAKNARDGIYGERAVMII